MFQERLSQVFPKEELPPSFTKSKKNGVLKPSHSGYPIQTDLYCSFLAWTIDLFAVGDG
jgi:hypothetical protein